MNKTFIFFAGRMLNTAHIIVISHDMDFIYLHMVGDNHYTECYENNPTGLALRWNELQNSLCLPEMEGEG